MYKKVSENYFIKVSLKIQKLTTKSLICYSLEYFDSNDACYITVRTDEDIEIVKRSS